MTAHRVLVHREMQVEQNKIPHYLLRFSFKNQENNISTPYQFVPQTEQVLCYCYTLVRSILCVKEI